MLDLPGRQAEFNADSRGQWGTFESHRRRVSTLLGAGTTGGGTRLCVLGAGNCNDLDLPALLTSHREVHLVDLDPAAMEAGAIRQEVADHPGLRRHGGIDLTGMLESIASWSPNSDDHRCGPPSPRSLARRPDRPGVAGAVRPRRLDLPAQPAPRLLLSGDRRPSPPVPRGRPGHPRRPPPIAGPTGHSTGGTATLITDVASSEHYPPLPDVPEHASGGLAADNSNGSGPTSRASSRGRSSRPFDWRWAGIRSPSRTIPPWRWRLHSRIYLVWALIVPDEPEPIALTLVTPSGVGGWRASRGGCRGPRRSPRIRRRSPAPSR